MTEYSEKDVNFALDAIQNSEVRESEKFRAWIAEEENKKLFIDLMAQKEAIMRERHLRNLRFKKRAKIISFAATVAAILTFAVFIPDFFRQTPPQNINKEIHFFTANTNINEVILEVEEKTPEVIKDSFMVINTPAKKSATEEKKVEYQTITTPRGKDFHLTLSDGTKVWINTESSLKFPNIFTGNERRVILRGEAYFDVSPNKKCPFIVCTEGLETVVLGTKFNVYSYNKEQRNITLVEGKVKVNNTISNESTLLNPGQNISYDQTEKSTVESVNTAVYTAWTEGMFYFEDKPLKEIMSTLGRWYNVDIFFENEDLYNIKFNFWASRNTNIGEAISLLNDLGKVNISMDNNRITINKK